MIEFEAKGISGAMVIILAMALALAVIMAQPAAAADLAGLSAPLHI